LFEGWRAETEARRGGRRLPLPIKLHGDAPDDRFAHQVAAVAVDFRQTPERLDLQAGISQLRKNRVAAPDSIGGSEALRCQQPLWSAAKHCGNDIGDQTGRAGTGNLGAPLSHWHPTTYFATAQ
jgi:hypothetical protein